jgi:hypothetical protein
MKEIIRRSKSDNWEDAKTEWVLSEVYEEEEPTTCLCGHHPIIEICVIGNKFNGRTATVGNVCVKKFLGLPSDKIFKSIKKISEDISRALNKEALDYANEKGWLRGDDYDFYNNTRRKRNLSEPRMNWRMDVNRRVLKGVRKQK